MGLWSYEQATMKLPAEVEQLEHEEEALLLEVLALKHAILHIRQEIASSPSARVLPTSADKSGRNQICHFCKEVFALNALICRHCKRPSLANLDEFTALECYVRAQVQAVAGKR